MANQLNIHWNNLELPQPPNTTFSLPPSSSVRVSIFCTSVNSLQNLLQRVRFESVGGLCSRLVYKSKLKFRQTKWLQLIEKINQAMLKMLQMNLPQILNKVLNLSSQEDQQVPSRAILEWFLLKLQGFARLLVRLIVTSYQAGVLFKQCLGIGHMWEIIVTLMALVSQIWSNCQLVLDKTFNCYSVAYKTMQQSCLNQKAWSSLHVPEDLKLWISEEIVSLGLESPDIFRISLPKSKSVEVNLKIMHDEIKKKEDDFVAEDYVEDSEDLGEIISRGDIITRPVEELSNIKDKEVKIVDKTDDISNSHFDKIAECVISKTCKKPKKQNTRKLKNILKVDSVLQLAETLNSSLEKINDSKTNETIERKKKAKVKKVIQTSVKNESIGSKTSCKILEKEDLESKVNKIENKNKKLKKQFKKMMKDKANLLKQLQKIQDNKNSSKIKVSRANQVRNKMKRKLKTYQAADFTEIEKINKKQKMTKKKKKMNMFDVEDIE